MSHEVLNIPKLALIYVPFIDGSRAVLLKHVRALSPDLIVAPYATGWFIHLPQKPQPEWLNRVIDWARPKGYEWVCFDELGDEPSDLKPYYM